MNTPTTIAQNTKPKVKKKNYKWFIGIDVSKNELDFAVVRENELLLHKEIRNEKSEIQTFCRHLKDKIDGFRIGNALFCMEETGFYSARVTAVLHGLKANFVIENALRMKRSLGLIRGKDDKEDAVRIADYASKHHMDLKLWRPRRPIMDELKLLMALRNRLLETSVSLSNPVTEQELYVKAALRRKLNSLCKKTFISINQDRELAERTIDELIAGDLRLRRLFEIVTSVKGIGRVTAIHILLSTNEFLDINCPKKFACYAGIAPFKSESGLTKRKDRVSRIANRKMKSLLHICAMGSVYRNPELKAFFDRKTKIEGKPGMLVINAIRYKLILRIFTCVRQDRLYCTSYARSKESPAELANLEEVAREFQNSAMLSREAAIELTPAIDI